MKDDELRELLDDWGALQRFERDVEAGLWKRWRARQRRRIAIGIAAALVVSVSLFMVLTPSSERVDLDDPAEVVAFGGPEEWDLQKADEYRDKELDKYPHNLLLTYAKAGHLRIVIIDETNRIFLQENIRGFKYAFPIAANKQARLGIPRTATDNAAPSRSVMTIVSSTKDVPTVEDLKVKIPNTLSCSGSSDNEVLRALTQLRDILMPLFPGADIRVGLLPSD